jgi:hypothetical protein
MIVCVEPFAISLHEALDTMRSLSERPWLPGLHERLTHEVIPNRAFKEREKRRPFANADQPVLVYDDAGPTTWGIDVSVHRPRNPAADLVHLGQRNRVVGGEADLNLVAVEDASFVDDRKRPAHADRVIILDESDKLTP